MEYLQQIIRSYGLRITEARMIVLDAFLRSGQVFDHHALAEVCQGRVDRVTLYRTLHVFYLHQLLYRVPSATGIMQYGLRGLSGERPGGHLHLVCGVCGKITTVDPFSAPAIPLPRGFHSQSVDLIVGGTCGDCAPAALTPAAVLPPGGPLPRARGPRSRR